MKPVSSRTAVLLALVAAGCATEKAATPAPAPVAAPVASVADAGIAAAPPAPVKLPGEEVLAQQPAIGPLKAFDAPVPQRTVLPNGLQIFVVERPGDGLEAVDLLIKHGSAMDPPGREGLASLTAGMLEAGSAGKTQIQMAQAVDAIGADLGVGASVEATAVSISGLPTRLPEMITLLSQVALKPNFEPAEWKRLQAQRKAELLAARAQPRTGAMLSFGAAVYGKHPFGQPAAGTPESVDALTLQDLQGAFAAFSPADSAVVAVGGAKAQDVVALVTRTLGGWKAPRGAAGKLTEAQLLARAPVPAERPRLVLVDYPAKPQSMLVVGQPAVPRASPDYLALSVLNSVLGGSFTSRLNQNLREVHGYSYGASSRFGFGLGPGAFFAASSVKTDVTGAALREMLGELDRAVAQPLTEDDVRKGKALLAYRLVEGLEESGNAATTLGTIFLYGLPLEEFRQYVPRLQALTADEVRAAAQRTLQPSKMTVVIAGDAAKVAPQLEAEKTLQLPAPQRRDADGRLAK